MDDQSFMLPFTGFRENLSLIRSGEDNKHTKGFLNMIYCSLAHPNEMKVNQLEILVHKPSGRCGNAKYIVEVTLARITPSLTFRTNDQNEQMT